MSMSIVASKAAIETAKINIANAITAKGVTVDSTDGFSDFADKISSIVVVEGGLDTSDATAYAQNLLNGYTAYARGSKITGSYIDTKDRATKILLHMDGEIDSTSFVDDMGRPIANTGNVKISSALSKFGKAAYFSGSAYLSVSTDWALNAATDKDFTIDLWAYVNSWSAGTGFILVLAAGGIQIGRQESTSNWGIARNTQAWILTTNSLFSIGAWHHIAVTRASGTLRLFLDGVVVASSSASNNFVDTGLVRVGANLNGYIDELRVVKGIAKWTADFTPPTVPYTSIE